MLFQYISILFIIFSLLLYLIKLIYILIFKQKLNIVQNEEEGEIFKTIKQLYIIEWNSIVENNTQNNTPFFKCVICQEDNLQSRVCFDACGIIKHNFCPECIHQYGNTIIDTNTIDIKINCPLCKTTLWSNI
jgi:hypothetical protein